MSGLYPDVRAWQAGPDEGTAPALVEAIHRAEALVRSGRVDVAADAAAADAALAPFAGTAPAWCGAVDRVRGVLAAASGHDADAERLLTEAFETNTALGYAEWAAYTRFELGRLLVARDHEDDRVRGAHLLDRALAAAKKLGLHDLARRVLELV